MNGGSTSESQALRQGNNFKYVIKFLINVIVGPPTKKMRTDTGSEPFYSSQTSRTSQSPLLTDPKLKSPGGKIFCFL